MEPPDSVAVEKALSNRAESISVSASSVPRYGASSALRTTDVRGAAKRREAGVNALAEAKRLDDANYEAQGDDLRKLVEEVEYANATSQRELAAQHKAYLMQQREEQRQMRAAAKDEGKGAIMEGGLMSGFGVSWR